MLGTTRGKLLNQYTPDYVLYDLETTGIASGSLDRRLQMIISIL